MNENAGFITKMDQLLVETRIRDLAHYALGDRSTRVARMSAVMSKLPAGWYLIGLGPHFSYIIRVGSSEITIGRPASLLEESCDSIIDYVVNDATLTGPREVSRLHVSVRVDKEQEALEIRDEGSSTGTWVLPGDAPLEADLWHMLENGHVISLGSGQINLFVVVRVGELNTE